MTGARDADVRRAAVRAALEVPGVSALQPSLADRLATAAPRARRAMAGAGIPSTEAGIRLKHTADEGWHVEVRCAIEQDHRALDVARQVRAHVHAAVTAHLNQYGTPAPVTVLVTVARTG
ncbi:hypothetical protein GCM10027074_28890 [Streptomyces deserti]